MHNKGIALVCTLAGICVTVISMLLTGEFMIKLAGESTKLKIMFLSLGLSLDLAKQAMPVLALIGIKKRQYFFSIILMIAYGLMVVVSYTASASTMQDRINATTSAVEQSASSPAQIKLLTDLIEDKRQLLNEQRAANQISRMSLTASEISDLNEQAMTLMNTQVVATETILKKHSEVVVFAVAVMVEVLSPLMWLCILMVDTRTAPRIEIPNKPAPQNASYSADFIIKNNSSQSRQITSDARDTKQGEGCEAQLVSVQQPNTRQSALGTNTTRASREKPIKPPLVVSEYSAAKHAVLHNEVKPNFREIQANFKLSRSEVTRCLKELTTEGVLIAGAGNRYYRI